jgi:16S rRNA (adenine1518-N6/adenine1519-N6)-dimethyltransferase
VSTESASLRRRTRDAIEALGVRPRRRLGQSFLVDPVYVERIVSAARVDGEAVLEIGPGLGALSARLAELAAELALVEIDAELAAALRDGLAARPNVRVTHGDALAVDLDEVLPAGRRVVVVANLPYSVGTQILMRLLEERVRFSRMVLMLQREVAERVTAEPGTRAYGIPTLWTKLHADAEILFRVPAGAFVPRPKVESAVLRLSVRSTPRVALASEERFRAIVRAAFGQRRKTLGRALSGIVSPSQFGEAGIDPRRRGETLSLEEFARLSNADA